MLSVRNLIDTTSLTADDITQILDTARSFAEVNSRAIKKVPALRGRTIVNLFLEPSTRTRSSFELAEKRLSADSLNMSGSTSSVVKGESLADTIQTIAAMNVDMFVCRARLAGTPYLITQNTDAVVVNAGDGKHQHPTQALLDLFTIRENFGHLDGLKVDETNVVATLRGKRLELTAGEFKLLVKLVAHRGRVFARPANERTIDVQVANLRKKLGKWGDHIETIRGVGYRISV